MIEGLNLPSWVQFTLTLAGGWLTGIATMVVAFWKRITSFEKGVGIRVQKVEQTVYGPREDPSSGLVAKMAHADNGVTRMERLLVKICQKLGIEDGLD